MKPGEYKDKFAEECRLRDAGPLLKRVQELEDELKARPSLSTATVQLIVTSLGDKANYYFKKSTESTDNVLDQDLQVWRILANDYKSAFDYMNAFLQSRRLSASRTEQE